jgi:putative ABC transport system permease protein
MDFWMAYDELANAFDLDGAFDFVSLTLAPGASPSPVIAELDRLLTPMAAVVPRASGSPFPHPRLG